MPLPTFRLTGDGVLGMGASTLRALLPTAPAPVNVKLGRRRPLGRSIAPRLAHFLTLPPADMASQLPESLDYYTKADASIRRMYANDQLGCCVISGKGHNLGVYTGNDTDSGGVALCSDNEIVSEYHRLCGPGDNGCNIESVLRNMMAGGIRQSGKLRKIDGYVSIDWRNPIEVKTAALIFGAVTIGFDCRAAFLNSDVWDLTNTRSVGGHDVSIVGWLANGNYVVSSWGRLYEFTPRAINAYVDEAFVILAPEWYGDDDMSPAGLNVEGLKRALADFAAGIIPDVPPPVDPPGPNPPPVDPPGPVDPPVDPPPVPPVPPTPVDPPAYAVSVTGTVPVGAFGRRETITLTGMATPAARLNKLPQGEPMNCPCCGCCPCCCPAGANTAGVMSAAPGVGNWRGFFANANGELMIELDDPSDRCSAFVPGSPIPRRRAGAIPWALIVQLIGIAAPIVIADIQAGKTWAEIIADVIAALTAAKPKMMARHGLTPEQWARIIQLVLQFLPLFL